MAYNMDDVLNGFFGVPTGDASSAAKAAQRDIDAIQKTVMKTSDEISARIKELNDNLKKDFGSDNLASGQLAGTSAATNSSIKDTSSKVSETQNPNPNVLESFNGISEVIKSKVFGQDDFIKKLVIAFKRPFVSERDDNDAMNSVYITGPTCSGKHFALNTIAEELATRKIIKSGKIYTMDLSLYPTSSEEKLFLQDLYSALSSEAQIILFEKYEQCHISLLGKLSELVSTGECKLSDRYVLQKGQLINVANSLSGNAVSSFEATGKYLIFISSKPVDKLAGVMGAPFVNSLGDVCETKAIDDETMKKISLVQEQKLIEKSKSQLLFDITLEDSFKEYILMQSEKGKGIKGILGAYVDTLKALAELRLERDDLPSSALTLKYGKLQTAIEAAKENAEDAKENASEAIDIPIIVAGTEEISLRSLIPGGYNGELEAVKEEMAAIVGLSTVKDYIYSLEEYYNVQKRRREAGLKAGEVSKHMIFTGNPGTGKTTIARIVSKYLKAIGVLSGGQLIEVSRADLVGRYVGHTAPLVNQVIKSALGGVLFIDEAYSLYRGGEDNFGLEAIDTLVKGIEDNRDDLIVILAGYSKEMEDFLESNSGLKSRFPNIIDFPDYTGEELLKIAEITAKSKGYVIDTKAKKPMLEYFNHVQETRAKDAGNGRLVRNKIEEAILNQSRRLVAEKDADISLLLKKDFELKDED